ncbi:hypothetical protein BN1195_03099 [Chryseobacterium oranimense G311]|uniref:hypothetical protein n=1 Tax=Chryseobacterium oranimense TaxID=421058 RepID=UPI0005338FC7|nr:hypothetical protein [Chryseobacterium oranimense]CEJ70761.1 hypothetical protein BN1195_03099 [Chryseobacterium oranimense G311]
MNLAKLNLEELEAHETIVVNGGGNGGWVWLAEQVIENWNEIKSGLSDGWNGHYNPPK